MDDYSEQLYAAKSSAYQVRRATAAVRHDIRDYVYDADNDDDDDGAAEPAYLRYHRGSVGRASAPRNLLDAVELASLADVVVGGGSAGSDTTTSNDADDGDMVDVDIDDSYSDSSSGEHGFRPEVYPVVSSAMVYANQADVPLATDSQRNAVDTRQQKHVEVQLVARRVGGDNDSVKSWEAGDDGTVVESTHKATKPANALDQASEDRTDGSSSQSYAYSYPYYYDADGSRSHALDGKDLGEHRPILDRQTSSPSLGQGEVSQSDADVIIASYFNETDSSDSDEVINVFRTTSLPPSPPLSPPASPPLVESPTAVPLLADNSVEDPVDCVVGLEAELAGQPHELTPTVAEQHSIYNTVLVASRVSGGRSVSSGSATTSFENAAAFQSITQGFQPFAPGQSHDEIMLKSAQVPDVAYGGRRRSSSGRQVFSTISINQNQDLLGRAAEDIHGAYGKIADGDGSDEQTPTTATKPCLAISPPDDDHEAATVRIRPRNLSVSSSSVSSADEDKENQSPAILVPPPPSPMHPASFGSLRNRRIRPGGGGVISPTSPFADVTLKPIHLHSKEPIFLSSSAKSEGKETESFRRGAMRRASDGWRQQLVDGSLARILKHATDAINVATQKDSIQELESWLSEYVDVVIGVSSTFVVVGAILVGALSFTDDTGRDYFGVKTLTYKCALQATAYRDVHECLVHIRLPSIFPLLGVTASSSALHWFVITDLYFWAVFGCFVSIPPLIAVTGLALLSVAYGALVVLLTSEKFLRWILDTTKRLMLEQMDVADVITDIIDGTDEGLFGDL
ncbi:hypothetical protein POJ06DRAFT_258938 [Lipomyces tetrasporus]|uniref:Transmembrane protein n=1 Tax=Lipomyces tetrasporus TaxID=54092 RepID=A0AAD7QNV0_9ASCO|nr:uncharacterized protein POJ06DRAFT_258938 [Lipomyces tetrasporus]KAJ8098241.1 hypothetical protein POJ06DRAFT_258938 [Lipomyces tetrasporus]